MIRQDFMGWRRYDTKRWCSGVYEDGPGVTTGDWMGWNILDYVGFNVYSSDSLGVRVRYSHGTMLSLSCACYTLFLALAEPQSATSDLIVIPVLQIFASADTFIAVRVLSIPFSDGHHQMSQGVHLRSALNISDLSRRQPAHTPNVRPATTDPESPLARIRRHPRRSLHPLLLLLTVRVDRHAFLEPRSRG